MRIVICTLHMIWLGLGVGRGAHGLEGWLCQRGLVGRERARTGRTAGREQDRANSRECDKEENPSVFQGWAQLLTDYSQTAQPKFPWQTNAGQLCTLPGSRKIAACSPYLISNSRRRLMKSKRKVFTKLSGLSPRRRTHTSPSRAGSAFSIYARTITSAWLITRPSSPRPRKRSILTASAWRAYVSFAARRTFTRNWKP